MFWPCETRTSTCRSFATISSGLYRFLAIAVLLDVKDIPQVGPLQWGRITVVSRVTLSNWDAALGRNLDGFRLDRKDGGALLAKARDGESAAVIKLAELMRRPHHGN